jgi:flavodoxin
MGQIAAYVFTGILVVCFIAPLATPSGSMIPRGITVAVLVALVVLWALFLFKGMPMGLKIPLYVVFYFIFAVVAVPAGIGSIIFGVADRPRAEKPTQIGSETGKGRIAMVYHPGMSPLVSDTVKKMASILNGDGYAVTLMTANGKRVIDQSAYKALIITSPVYAGTTRPPLGAFLAANDPLTLPCFALLTGGAADDKAANLEKLGATVKNEGGTLLGGIKVRQGTAPDAVAKELESFARTIGNALAAR